MSKIYDNYKTVQKYKNAGISKIKKYFFWFWFWYGIICWLQGKRIFSDILKKPTLL